MLNNVVARPVEHRSDSSIGFKQAVIRAIVQSLGVLKRRRHARNRDAKKCDAAFAERKADQSIIVGEFVTCTLDVDRDGTGRDPSVAVNQRDCRMRVVLAETSGRDIGWVIRDAQVAPCDEQWPLVWSGTS